MLALDLRKDGPQDAALEHDRDGRATGSATPSSFSSSSAIRSRDRAMRSLARSRAGLERGGVGLAGIEARVEAEEAQDPQMILGDPLQGIADEPDVALLEIGKAAEIVEQLAAQRIGEKRVDGEIAPRRILLPVVGEGDRRAPAVGRDVAFARS